MVLKTPPRIGVLSDNVSETATPVEFTEQGDGVASDESVDQRSFVAQSSSCCRLPRRSQAEAACGKRRLANWARCCGEKASTHRAWPAGGEPVVPDARDKQIAELQRMVAKSEARARHAEALVALQKKVADLLGQLPSEDETP